MENIFVNGTFDILHRGHVELLNYAKKFGSHLYVGIDSDERVKSLKGIDRPINSEKDRQFLLMNLKCVDDVFIFNSDQELCNLVQKICPKYMIVGSDYKNKKVIGSEYSNSVLFFNRIEPYATTKTIQSIIDRR